MDDTIFYIKNYILPFLIFLTFYVVCHLLVSTYLYNKRITPRNKIQLSFETFLVSVLLENTDSDYYQKRLKLLKETLPLEKKWFKKLAISSLIQYKKNVRGKYAMRIPEIYEDLGLHHYTLERLKSRYLNPKCEALYDIQIIGYRKKMKEILIPFLTHSRKVIRSNAYMTYFTLFQNVKGHSKHPKFYISELNILKIMDVMHQKRINSKLNTGRRLHSKNTSLQKIGIKTLVLFNDKSHDNQIISLLDSKDNSIISEVIFAIRDLYIFEGEQKILDKLFSFSISLQDQALKTLKVIGSTSTVEYLIEHFKELATPELQFSALEAIYHVDKQSAINLSINSIDKFTMYQHIEHLNNYGN